MADVHVTTALVNTSLVEDTATALVNTSLLEDTLTAEEKPVIISVVTQVRFFYSILEIPTGVCITTVNLIVLVCFIKFKLLKRKPNIYIFSLCISDLLAGVDILFIAYMNAFALKNPGVFRHMCVLAATGQYFVHATSLFGMLCATIERYVHIVHPFAHANYQDSNLHLLVVALGWCLYSALTLTLFFTNVWRKEAYCFLGNVSQPLIYIMIAIVSAVPQLIGIGVLMFKILRVIRKHKVQIVALQQLESNHTTGQTGSAPGEVTAGVTAGTSGGQSSRTLQDSASSCVLLPAFQKENRKRTRIVVMLVVVTYACLFPIIFTLLLKSVMDPGVIYSPYWVAYGELTNYLMVLNSLIDPFLCQRFSPDIKKAYKNLFRGNHLQPISN